MKKFFTIFVVALLVTLLLCGCQSNENTQSEIATDNIESTTVQNQSEEVLDIENLKENEFRISDLPGKITVSDLYNVYSLDNEYTDEMCAEQSVEPDRMKLYLDTQKEYGGINMFIIPKSNPIATTDFQIQIKVKSEKNYGIDNFAELSSSDFSMYKEALMQSFETALNTELTSTVYENKSKKWIVFDCYMTDHQTRYATILNGKMIYVIGKSTIGPLTNSQKNEITQIIDSLKF
ncbi:MAG: hypothetical protein E7473_01315 [Ruminococcaceae bacterium]|nr:hypothetical protein [Oscillospiraceae bacterium]